MKDQSKSNPERGDEFNLGVRRTFLGSLGSLVGASVLGGCADPAIEESPPLSTSLAAIGTTPVKWVDTVEVDLRKSLGCVESEVVIARGFAVANDGGGGVFSWDPSTSSGDDGGTVIVPTIQCGATVIGRWIRIYSGHLDVRWFGARAGSSTYAAQNDIAIQRALAVATPVGGVDGGRIFFPQGTWHVSSTIVITKDDSVVLCGPGGAGTWGSAGAYDHRSAKLLWSGGAGTMVDFASTMRCGIVGLMLDGGGVATVGFRLRTTDAPAKGNFLEDVVISNLASTGIAVHVGNDPTESVNHDLAFNTFKRFWLNGGAIGVQQEGNQTVSTVFEDGVFTSQLQHGARFLGGDITVSRCFFCADASAVAEVYVAAKAQYARFVGNTHETECLTTYAFEPTTSTLLRPMATLFLGVRVLYRRSTGSPRRILDFQQNGHLTLVSCTFDGEVTSNAPAVHLAPPLMGYADAGLIQEIGCRYLNGAHASVNPVAGAYTSLYSNGSPAMPTYTPIMGEHLTTGTRMKFHNGQLQLQDNNNGSGAVLGTRLSTYLGQLIIEPTESRDGAYLVVVRNNGIVFTLNHGGGPGFYGTTSQPATRPTVTGSRGDNAALADLLTKLASLGLINDGTTA
ncbi:hypothetical protein [Sorangium sp. So ce131]|uniref:hypothetical protein n=1 Tax=Sorangium sp. So ce131 TaxID=3133282 RepID=UPI003F5F6401